MLFNILNTNSKIRESSKVYYFKGCGDIHKKLTKINVKVEHIPLDSITGTLFSLVYCLKILASSRTSVLHLWMYHPCVIIGCLAKLLLHNRIIWSLHHSNFDVEYNKRFTLFIIKISSYLSHFIPNIIHSCSKAAIKQHLNIGYKNNFIFIPNGVDTNIFKYDKGRVDNKYFPEINNPFIIGFFARWDPLKNHQGLIEQFALSLKKKSNLCLLLCGINVDIFNESLLKLISIYKIPERNIRLLGKQENISTLYHELDLFCLPSHGEAFPVVLCESLASSVPCISTNVGDCSYILNPVCSVVDITSFNDQFLYYSSLSISETSELRKKCRTHILKNYQLSMVAKSYLMLYTQLN